MGALRAFKYHFYNLLRLPDSAKSIAIGIAFGAAVSATPTMGLQILIAIGLSWIFGGNAVAAAIGTIWGNPLTFPFYWIASFKLGMFLMPMPGLEKVFSLGKIEAFATKIVKMFWNFDFSGIWDGLIKIYDVWIRMMLGSIPFFIITWIVFYLVFYYLISKLQIVRQQKIYLGYLKRLRDLPHHLRQIPASMKENIKKIRIRRTKK